MRQLDKYLLYTSVLAIFTEDISFKYIIDWKLFYLILITNFAILAYKNEIKIHKNFIYFFLFLIIHGVLGFLIYQNSIVSLIAQILGIGISSIFYFNVVKKFGVKLLTKIYLQFAYFFAILSLIMFYFNINTFSKYRLNGIMSEPAHYAAIMLPAVFLCFVEEKYLKFIIILVTIFLTQSSVGFIGLFLILIIPILKVKYFLKYSIVVFLIAIASFFYLKSKWNEPIDENRSNKVVRRLKETHETFSSFITGKFNNNVNLSSYAFISNAFVTKSVLIDKPLGTGLGAYKHEYDKYYKYLKPPSYLTTSLRKINRTDANSLFLRILSDFGLFAIVIFFIFIYKSILIFRNDSKKIQQSTFFYLVVKLIREGHYFPPEFYFFLLIFFNNTDDENITHS